MEDMKEKSTQITEILRRTMEAIEESKRDIFEISETARNECTILQRELEELQNKVLHTIKEVEILEKQEKASRKILLNVSKNFSKYTEEDIRQAYENANQLQIKLMLKRQEEEELIKRRTDLELRLRSTQDILKKSENLVSKVCVAFDFLSGDLDNLSDTIEDMSYRSALGKRIIQVQEEERQRIAMDIHDGPAQSLTNAVIKTEVCERLMDIDIARAKDAITDLKKILRGSIKDIRSIIYNLRPAALDDLGLIPTVQRYITKFQDETGIEVDLIILSQVEINDNIKNIALFRIIQEALNNIRKHSSATRAKVKIEITKTTIYILIEDNGIGFDIADMDLNNSNKGFGLLNMRERVELLSGKFEIKSDKNKGTKIIINVENKS